MGGTRYPTKRPPGRAGLYISIDDRELLRALDKLDKVTQKNTQRRILRRSAAPIRDEAKKLVPVVTGELQRSIKIYTTGKKGLALARVESRLPHAHLVELGTKPHFQYRKLKTDRKKRRVVHPGAKPKPYLRPAFDTKKNESIEIARRELRTEILKSAK